MHNAGKCDMKVFSLYLLLINFLAYRLEGEVDMCPICLNALNDIPAKLLPCGHAIHTKCLTALGENLT